MLTPHLHSSLAYVHLLQEFANRKLLTAKLINGVLVVNFLASHDDIILHALRANESHAIRWIQQHHTEYLFSSEGNIPPGLPLLV